MKYTEVNPFTGKNIDEDAPTTSTAGVAATGDDPTVVMKKKKKKLYDGRTSIAKKFVERILKQRESRRLTKEEVELDEKKSQGMFIVLEKGSKNKVIGQFKQKEQAIKMMKKNAGSKIIQIGKFATDDGKPVDIKVGDNLSYTRVKLATKIKEEVELEEALKPKDKKVVDAFYDGKSMKGDTLSTDGKKLEKSGLGAQTIATSSGSKFKVVAKMDGKHTQSVVSYIKKSFPKNVVEEITEGTMASGLFSNNPETSNKSGYELTKFFKKKPNAKQAYGFVDRHIPDDILGDDIAALAGELDDAPGRLKDFPYKKQKKAYSKIDPRSVVLNRLADFTDDKNAMLLVKTLMNMGVKPIKLGTGRAGKGEYDPIKTNINPSKIDAILKKFGVSDPKQISFKEETMEITEEVMTLKTKDNVMGLKVFNGAKGLGLKAALLGKYVRVKGSKKQINDFGRTVIGKSSMGSPTQLSPLQVDKIPREDKMLNKRLKEEIKSRSFSNFVLETANDFGVEYLLTENNIKILQNIVKKKQNAKMKFKDNKKATVDLFTASAIMKVYDAVKPDNKKKMEKLINGTLPEFLKIQAFAMKQVKMR